ncbi:hypothetical protein [Rhizobium croatiense]|uniref:Uncharacterized protein n=1 Tax=Rhizobium croatiense TaxID=2867516 RepID=A0ABS7LZ95_9HYPH|nr:hypothetical protein [Rhizobium croatiense]MBY4629291.1 hypothetical protein [Rhizobium croatiense]
MGSVIALSLMMQSCARALVADGESTVRINAQQGGGEAKDVRGGDVPVIVALMKIATELFADFDQKL